jgi:glycosyltransferase involved in cell wall biosynthesis
MREINIALITIDFPPQRTSAAVQMRDLAEEFARQGHKPTIIVPSAGLSKPWKLEHVGGVDVLRIRARAMRDIGYLKRTFNETLLPFMMIAGLYRSPLWNKRWDLIAWYSPTIFFGLLILLLKRRSQGHAYLILRDIFPEWAVDLGLIRKSPIYWYFRSVAHLQYIAADTIGVQTESDLSYLSRWAHTTGRTLEVLRNWQRVDKPRCKSSIDFASTSLRGRKIFVYIGNMGIAQGMDILIDLAASLIDRRDVGFAFVGRGSEENRLRALATQRCMDNIVFFNEIPSDEIPALLIQCYAGLIALDPRHKSNNIPGKFLRYLHAGLPVLGRANQDTDLITLINEENVGRAFSGEALPGMKAFVIEICGDSRLRERMSGRAKDLAGRRFLPSIAAEQIVSHVPT